jgi:hypothetical protein
LKIIKPPQPTTTKTPWVGFQTTCDDCACEFKLEKGDKVKFNSDQRDGDYYSLKCPGCKKTINLSANLFTKQPRGKTR